MARLARALAVGGSYDSGMMRQDGTTKGDGYFGRLPNAHGGMSTELSANSEMNGVDTLYPLINPNLTAAQLLRLLRGQQPTPEIYDAAEAHAQSRLMQGRGPFAGPSEQRAAPQLPLAYAPVYPKLPSLLDY
jgi:hypothetical protein